MHLSNKEVFTEEEARFYIAEIVCAIEFLHKKNIVYRNLKPENVLVGLDGHIKLTDFGLAIQLGKDSESQSRSFCGIPADFSPELPPSKIYQKEEDIFGIGALFYEMLVGKSLYFEEDFNSDLELF